MTTTMDDVDKESSVTKGYRSKCIEKFNLLPVPQEWKLSKELSDEMNNEDVWKKYLEYRDKKKSLEGVSSDDCSVDEGEESKGLLELWESKLVSDAKNTNCEGWLEHVILHIWASWDCDDSLRTAVYDTEMFSPYAIPRVIELNHRYHMRGRIYSAEFHAVWQFKLVRFDGKNGDNKSEEYEMLWPAGWTFPDALYDSKTCKELLCSNCYDDPPPYGKEEIDLEGWEPVEKINVKNFTPLTVKRMKLWLFGTGSSELIKVSDFDFVNFLLTSVATPNFSTLKGHIGHTWEPRYSYFLRENLKELPYKVTWLEYQSRLVTQSLRPNCDEYYEPYNDLLAKSHWGRKVLEFEDQQRQEGHGDQDGDEEFDGCDDEDGEEDLNEVPWLVWERAESRRGLGGDCSIM